MADGNIAAIAKAAIEQGNTEIRRAEEDELKQIYDSIIQPALNTFKSDYLALKNATNTWNKFRSSYKKRSNTKSRTSYFKNQLSKYIESQKIAIEAFDKLQNAVNEFYGLQVVVAYVYRSAETGQIDIGLFENSIENLTQKDSRMAYFRNLKLHKDNILKFEEYNDIGLNNTANEVYARWDIAKTKGKDWAISHDWSQFQGQGLPILWRANNKWEGRKLNNEGVIAEAYAQFYLNQTRLFDDAVNGAGENDVETYITNPDYGASSVDAVSGFLQGDVGIGRFQFAVKKENASPARMEEIYELFKDVNNLLSFEKQVNIFKEDQKKKEEKSKGYAIQNLSEAMQETADEICDILDYESAIEKVLVPELGLRYSVYKEKQEKKNQRRKRRR